MQPSEKNASAQLNIYSHSSKLLSLLSKQHIQQMLVQFVCWNKRREKATEICEDAHPLHTSGEFCIAVTLECKFFYALTQKKA